MWKKLRNFLFLLGPIIVSPFLTVSLTINTNSTPEALQLAKDEAKSKITDKFNKEETKFFNLENKFYFQKRGLSWESFIQAIDNESIYYIASNMSIYMLNKKTGNTRKTVFEAIKEGPGDHDYSERRLEAVITNKNQDIFVITEKSDYWPSSKKVYTVYKIDVHNNHAITKLYQVKYDSIYTNFIFLGTNPVNGDVYFSSYQSNGSNNSKIYTINATTNKTVYTAAVSPKIINNRTKTFHYKNNVHFINAATGGIKKWEPSSNKWTNVTSDFYSLIFQYKSNEWYFGSFYGELIKYNPITNALVTIDLASKNPNIKMNKFHFEQMHQDKFGNIYVFTDDNRLYRFYPTTRVLELIDTSVDSVSILKNKSFILYLKQKVFMSYDPKTLETKQASNPSRKFTRFLYSGSSNHFVRLNSYYMYEIFDSILDIRKKIQKNLEIKSNMVPSSVQRFPDSSDFKITKWEPDDTLGNIYVEGILPYKLNPNSLDQTFSFTIFDLKGTMFQTEKKAWIDSKKNAFQKIDAATSIASINTILNNQLNIIESAFNNYRQKITTFYTNKISNLWNYLNTKSQAAIPSGTQISTQDIEAWKNAKEKSVQRIEEYLKVSHSYKDIDKILTIENDSIWQANMRFHVAIEENKAFLLQKKSKIKDIEKLWKDLNGTLPELVEGAHVDIVSELEKTWNNAKSLAIDNIMKVIVENSMDVVFQEQKTIIQKTFNDYKEAIEKANNDLLVLIDAKKETSIETITSVWDNLNNNIPRLNTPSNITLNNFKKIWDEILQDAKTAINSKTTLISIDTEAKLQESNILDAFNNYKDAIEASNNSQSINDAKQKSITIVTNFKKGLQGNIPHLIAGAILPTNQQTIWNNVLSKAISAINSKKTVNDVKATRIAQETAILNAFNNYKDAIEQANNTKNVSDAKNDSIKKITDLKTKLDKTIPSPISPSVASLVKSKLTIYLNAVTGAQSAINSKTSVNDILATLKTHEEAIQKAFNDYIEAIQIEEDNIYKNNIIKHKKDKKTILTNLWNQFNGEITQLKQDFKYGSISFIEDKIWQQIKNTITDIDSKQSYDDVNTTFETQKQKIISSHQKYIKEMSLKYLNEKKDDLLQAWINSNKKAEAEIKQGAQISEQATKIWNDVKIKISSEMSSFNNFQNYANIKTAINDIYYLKLNLIHLEAVNYHLSIIKNNIFFKEKIKVMNDVSSWWNHFNQDLLSLLTEKQDPSLTADMLIWNSLLASFNEKLKNIVLEDALEPLKIINKENISKLYNKIKNQIKKQIEKTKVKKEPESKDSKTPIIIGGVLGGVAVIGLITGIIIFKKKKKTK